MPIIIEEGDSLEEATKKAEDRLSRSEFKAPLLSAEAYTKNVEMAEKLNRLFPPASVESTMQDIFSGKREPEIKADPPTLADQEPMLQFFAYAHLPEHLQRISKWFSVLANLIVDNLPRNLERTVALRKLLEAKDCAVRARLYK